MQRSLASPSPAGVFMASSSASTFGAPSAQSAAAVNFPTSGRTSAQALTASMAPPRRIYTGPPTTKEYQERNYWGEDPLGPAMMADRVTPSPIWGEYAKHFLRSLSLPPGQSTALFLSAHLTEPTSSFTDVMAALALVGLPFASDRIPPSISQSSPSSLQWTAVGPLIVYHQEQVPARQSDKPIISASASYFDPLDRYVDVEHSAESATSSSSPSSTEATLTPVSALLLDSDAGHQMKLLTEFTSGRSYTCRLVLFNPLTNRVKVRVMQKIPEGSVSVGGGVDSRTRTLHLEAVSSLVVEFSFYFPRLGVFPHQAAQVSSRDIVVGYTDPVLLPVRAKAALAVDVKSWSHLASSGTDAQVLAYLALPSTNVHGLDWTALAWRWRIRRTFWQECVRIARDRLVFDSLLWSYSLHHQDVEAMKGWLTSIPSLTSAVGPFFVSSLLRVDAELVEFDQYRHLEYRPLIASRAHSLNDGIQNRELKAHWIEFLTYASFRYADLSQWTAQHRLQLVYLLLLQERVDDALLHFRSIQRPTSNATGDESLHFDYLSAYLAMYSDPSAALSIAKRYQQYPIVKKRRLFDGIEEAIEEMTIKRRDIDPSAPQHFTPFLAQPEDADTRDREMEALAATEPSLDFTVTGEGVTVICSNVKQLTLSVHLMDLEPLFSSNPFINTAGASSSSSSFLYLVPNYEERIDLPPSLPSASVRRVIPLPAPFRQANLLVSLRSGSVLVTRPHYAHGLSVSMMEAFGQLKVTSRTSNEPLAKVYVKVYAKEKEGGAVSFYKDGYTDWRGRFDYASLSTDRLPRVDEFAVLVHSEQEGALVKQAKPPGKSAA